MREGGLRREIRLDNAVPLFSLLSLTPTDLWFSEPGIVNTTTGRIPRVSSDPLSDYDYAT